MAWWQVLLVAIGVLVVGPVVAKILFSIVVLLLEGAMRSTVKVLNIGQAAYEASMNGVGTWWHRHGWHRPLRWWAWRCQQCFDKHQAARHRYRPR